ncbi:hypothetical protein EVAR_93512_1 [Eumeta japonica]|uniref:Uncharacterized protein n=1 Tax=Eumeta variegata TaxID=151549 RepID=A0A4C1TJH3_EUMVA|nr:hypothetical protein EVAR_93512_1 [Eumeta japonica]
MSPGERAAPPRRESLRPQYATAAYPPPYYPPYNAPPPGAWLGAPLLAMNGRHAAPNHRTPLAKLAMHAQGAPLIIQNRPDRRKYISAPDPRHHRLQQPQQLPAVDYRHHQQQPPRSMRVPRNNNADTVSVASDESSGSANSETALPRIIKPRKRRKKDRKPNNVTAHDLSAGNLDLADAERRCGMTAISAASRGLYEESYCGSAPLSYRLDVKVIDYPETATENYPISALGEALEATRFGLTEAASPAESAVSTCQCRYCDPVGQIWDADSVADLLDENSSGDFAPTKLEDSMKVVGPVARRGAETALRRSWSDPAARAPERRELASASPPTLASNLYSLFPPVRRTTSQEPRPSLALEISSEIVTSMNGHRDLEIKLFSSSPPTTRAERRSFFADDSESVRNECAPTIRDRNVNGVVQNVRGDAAAEASAGQDICDANLIAD